ncbi:MAG: GxxExxY protein [Candidatus Pacearchaeota archaeon]
MKEQQLKAIAQRIKALAEEVRNNLGCGFIEVIYQNALAIEFRRRKIEYLKEVNIEIFYKGESVGVDRPDFVVTKINGCKDPILLELKVSDKISDGHRIQLKSYCTSLPKNSNPVLKDFSGGILMAFPTCDIDACSKVKIFVVDQNFKVLIDDQAEEERLIQEKKIKTKEDNRKNKKEVN